MKIQKCVLIDMNLKSCVNGMLLFILENMMFTTLAVQAFGFSQLSQYQAVVGVSEPPIKYVFAKNLLIFGHHHQIL